MGDRNNRAPWSGSIPAFIVRQEAELRPRTLGTFLARGESSYRESSDPRTQEVDQSSRLLDICPKRGEFAYTECFDHWNSGESWAPRSADRGNRRNKLHPESARTSNTRDYQMAKGRYKNLTNRNQDHST